MTFRIYRAEVSTTLDDHQLPPHHRHSFAPIPSSTETRGRATIAVAGGDRPAFELHAAGAELVERGGRTLIRHRGKLMDAGAAVILARHVGSGLSISVPGPPRRAAA